MYFEKNALRMHHKGKEKFIQTFAINYFLHNFHWKKGKVLTYNVYDIQGELIKTQFFKVVYLLSKKFLADASFKQWQRKNS